MDPRAFVEDHGGPCNNRLGNDHVVLALSGGVDSSVAAMLLDRAIGDRLHCIFVDNGLLRKDEYHQCAGELPAHGPQHHRRGCAGPLLHALEGLDDPEAKRKAIGRTFIEVFDAEAKRISGIRNGWRKAPSTPT
jgi:GMP synthase (glutamine-hydrolysing)